MASYSLEFTRSAEKDLRRLPQSDQIRILREVNLLVDAPRPDGCKKLSGQERYRIRQGNYRVLYEIQNAKLIIVVVKVGHRRDIYQ